VDAIKEGDKLSCSYFLIDERSFRLFYFYYFGINSVGLTLLSELIKLDLLNSLIAYD
jgi:hypothetical protein